ncbi:MAG: asparagine synthase (glutamine-hydrolyzing), partial [Propionibacteriaceae bacterium]|nr:asparagine synthase (glutamine-hydrolyzing) [Propionibacteriaceae bacterium]
HYLELKAELEALGHEFSTRSDTEVVLEAFAEWGPAAFDRCNGMFGLAVYDRATGQVVLARDHFGIKPLYYAEVPGGLVFASEIRPLLATGLVGKAPNDRVVYRYLRYRAHEDTPETFFEGVRRLMPGELLTVASGQPAVVTAYTAFRAELEALAAERRPYTPAATRAYAERLERSVRWRLQSDVPVGTSLSGGLDSSTVAWLISRLMREDAGSTEAVGDRQRVFSAVFPGSVNDEERYVDAAVAACGDALTTHKVKPTADGFKADLADFVRSQEEPVISTGPYAQYKVMEMAAGHVTVLLDGQGADETMAGYIPYYRVYLRQLRREGRWGDWFREAAGAVDVFARLVRFDVQDRLRLKRRVDPMGFLKADFRARWRGERFPITRDNLKRRLIEDLFGNSIPALLRYEDKNTMRFSLEGRVPFLDTDLLRYLFSLDDDAIIRQGWNKRVLRDAVRGHLPDVIARRRNKIGFTTPQEEWFMRLKNSFYQIFLSEQFASRPYFDQPAVLAAFEGYVKGRAAVESMVFWRLINVELWLREFFDEPAPPPAAKADDFEPNEGKRLDIEVGGQVFRRYPIQTGLVDAATDLDAYVAGHVKAFFERLPAAGPGHAPATAGRWHLYISEKIVAITQGRSYFVWDIKAGFWASLLSRWVTKTPAGIGLGSPFTMQLAIQEVGLPRILLAAAGGALGKLVGRRGLFYTLVGSDVRAIDGPTEYSVYPANVSAKLAPKDPDAVARRLSARLRSLLPEPYAAQFGGVVVIDANDIGQNVLGTDAAASRRHLESAFADNPLGQEGQQTPLAVVFERGPAAAPPAAATA